MKASKKSDIVPQTVKTGAPKFELAKKKKFKNCDCTQFLTMHLVGHVAQTAWDLLGSTLARFAKAHIVACT